MAGTLQWHPAHSAAVKDLHTVRVANWSLDVLLYLLSCSSSTMHWKISLSSVTAFNLERDFLILDGRLSCGCLLHQGGATHRPQFQLPEVLGSCSIWIQSSKWNTFPGVKRRKKKKKEIFFLILQSFKSFLDECSTALPRCYMTEEHPTPTALRLKPFLSLETWFLHLVSVSVKQHHKWELLR